MWSLLILFVTACYAAELKYCKPCSYAGLQNHTSDWYMASAYNALLTNTSVCVAYSPGNGEYFDNELPRYGITLNGYICNYYCEDVEGIQRCEVFDVDGGYTWHKCVLPYHSVNGRCNLNAIKYHNGLSYCHNLKSDKWSVTHPPYCRASKTIIYRQVY